MTSSAKVQKTFNFNLLIIENIFIFAVGYAQAYEMNHEVKDRKQYGQYKGIKPILGVLRESGKKETDRKKNKAGAGADGGYFLSFFSIDPFIRYVRMLHA